jgi:hypothetical protein
MSISYSQLNSQLFWEPHYIAVAWTSIIGNTSCDHYCCMMSVRITENTCHVMPTHCCVMSPCIHCIVTVHERTQRKHFHSIVAWCVCWNMFTGLLPSNALSKSVTIHYFSWFVLINLRSALNKMDKRKISSDKSLWEHFYFAFYNHSVTLLTINLNNKYILFIFCCNISLINI